MVSFRLKISGMLEIMGVFLSSRNHHTFIRWRGPSDTGSEMLEEESVTRPSCKECKLMAGGSCKTAMLWPRIVLRPGNWLWEQRPTIGTPCYSNNMTTTFAVSDICLPDPWSLIRVPKTHPICSPNPRKENNKVFVRAAGICKQSARRRQTYVCKRRKGGCRHPRLLQSDVKVMTGKEYKCVTNLTFVLLSTVSRNEFIVRVVESQRQFGY